MYVYTVTLYNLRQFDVYADDIGEAYVLAKECTDEEAIKIERILGV